MDREDREEFKARLADESKYRPPTVAELKAEAAQQRPEQQRRSPQAPDDYAERLAELKADESVWPVIDAYVRQKTAGKGKALASKQREIDDLKAAGVTEIASSESLAKLETASDAYVASLLDNVPEARRTLIPRSLPRHELLLWLGENRRHLFGDPGAETTARRIAAVDMAAPRTSHKSDDPDHRLRELERAAQRKIRGM